MANDVGRRRARGRENAKIRLLAIDRMLRYDRYITSTEIMRRLLDVYGIECNRKTVYSDIYAIDRVTPVDITSGRYGGFKKINVLEALQDG